MLLGDFKLQELFTLFNKFLIGVTLWKQLVNYIKQTWKDSFCQTFCGNTSFIMVPVSLKQQYPLNWSTDF